MKKLDRQTVIEMRKSGLLLRVIAEKFFTSESAVSQMLKRASAPKVHMLDEAAIIDLRKSGLSQRVIADKFGTNQKAVSRMLKAAGVPHMVARQHNPKREQARSMKQSGMTYAEVGRALGISRQRVQQYLSLPVVSRLEFANQKGNRCELCGCAAKKLEAHHSTYAGDPDQLLCTSCHMKIDAQLGRTGKGKPHSRKSRMI